MFVKTDDCPNKTNSSALKPLIHRNLTVLFLHAVLQRSWPINGLGKVWDEFGPELTLFPFKVKYRAFNI